MLVNLSQSHCSTLSHCVWCELVTILTVKRHKYPYIRPKQSLIETYPRCSSSWRESLGRHQSRQSHTTDLFLGKGPVASSRQPSDSSCKTWSGRVDMRLWWRNNQKEARRWRRVFNYKGSPGAWMDEVVLVIRELVLVFQALIGSSQTLNLKQWNDVSHFCEGS